MLKTIQTKEDIRQKMIDVFGDAFPTIKPLSSYPMIVMNSPNSKEVAVNLHWMWFLPNNAAITYGENGKNRFLYYPNVDKQICGANLNITEVIDAVATYENNETTRLSVEKVTYVKKDKTITSTVMIVTFPDTEISEPNKLYTKSYDIMDIKI